MRGVQRDGDRAVVSGVWMPVVNLLTWGPDCSKMEVSCGLNGEGFSFACSPHNRILWSLTRIGVEAFCREFAAPSR